MKATQEPATKPCAMCGLILPLDSFGDSPRMKLGKKSYCKACCTIDARRRYAANPEHSRAVSRAASKRRYTTERGRQQHLRDIYGLTLQQYDDILAAQGNGCGICGTTVPGGKGDFHVDHDHKTGVVRGVLCHHCNLGIGHVGDDPQRMRNAAAYIEEKSA